MKGSKNMYKIIENITELNGILETMNGEEKNRKIYNAGYTMLYVSVDEDGNKDEYRTDMNFFVISDSEDSEEVRYAHKAAMSAQRLEDLKAGEYKLGGGVVDPLPEDAPYFVKDYYDYYKTPRGYHTRSLNSNGGWNVIGCESFVNQPILRYSNEIRSAVLLVHGDKAHSCYFSRDAYADMIRDSKYTDNKELMIIPGASHTDLYDGGGKNLIPFDKLESFFREYLK
jgi:fermentation-respiration switch protein FrsA (DUF1100 family)